jgi:cysteine synthase A
MICDGGERYLNTYYNNQWLEENGFDIAPYRKQLEQFYETGFLKTI